MAERTVKPGSCRTWFRCGGMRARALCSLPAGHRSRFHEHKFPTWTARVWLPTTKPMRFYFFAMPGGRLPKYLQK